VNRRFALALAVVALLVVSAGCLTYINDGGEVANETLDAEPPQAYDFATDRDTAINLSTGTRYTAPRCTTSPASTRYGSTGRPVHGRSALRVRGVPVSVPRRRGG